MSWFSSPAASISDALRRDGLHIVSPSGNRHVRNAVFTASGDAIENVELVLFCVKSYDTETAAKAFAPLVGARTAILSPAKRHR